MEDERIRHDGDRNTGYRDKEYPGPRSDSVLSWWSLAIVTVFLLLVVGGALMI